MKMKKPYTVTVGLAYKTQRQADGPIGTFKVDYVVTMTGDFTAHEPTKKFMLERNPTLKDDETNIEIRILRTTPGSFYFTEVTLYKGAMEVDKVYIKYMFCKITK